MHCRSRTLGWIGEHRGIETRIGISEGMEGMEIKPRLGREMLGVRSRPRETWLISLGG